MKTSNRIVAFLSVWNEGENIKEIVGEIYPWVDKLVVVDGRYEHFPGDTIKSKEPVMESFVDLIGAYNTEDIRSDYTRKCISGHRVIEKKIVHFPIHIVIPDGKPWKDEMAKRSVMFHYGRLGDWFLIIDGDEHLRHADWDGLQIYLKNFVNPRTIVVGVPFFDMKSGLKWHSPKMIRYNPGMSYDQNHYTLKLGEDFWYDTVNDGSRRQDLPEDAKILAFNHLNRAIIDPTRQAERVRYYLNHKAKTENPTPYDVGRDRYHRQTIRWTMEPIDRITQQKVLKEIDQPRQ